MENNKLLIGVNFTYSIPNIKESASRSYNLELYVLRDITLQQLFDGLRYGLRKMANADDKEAANSTAIYEKCSQVFINCIDKRKGSPNGTGAYFTHITLSSYQRPVDATPPPPGKTFAFYDSDLEKPLWKLGFVTSSRLIFDETGLFRYASQSGIDTSNLVEAFTPPLSGEADAPWKISFPEYNISTRLLYQFDTSPVEIIPPESPPKKPAQSLFSTLLPSLAALLVMLVARSFLMTGMSSNPSYRLQMILFSAAMSLTAILTGIFSWFQRKAGYEAELGQWRIHYENYINRLMDSIQKRQERDVKRMEALYPDMLTLIQPDEGGIYSLNSAVYSRAPQDEDFLTFRVGYSDQVESRFEIKGSEKDAVFSEADFRLVQRTVEERKQHTVEKRKIDIIQLFLHDEGKECEDELRNLHRLPVIIAERYRFLKNAPLLYSLKNRGAVGIVDSESGNPVSENFCAADYFVTRMIFELCYYHSPENLQFVIFFHRSDSQTEIERLITHYKFMPHFRGLFSDRSQFVFDEGSASLVFSGLLTLMSQRQSAGEAAPHVALVIYDEYSLREHAFAQFLPQPPEAGKPFENKLGLTFLYVTKYQEYLPPYCDSVFRFEKRKKSRSQPAQEIMTLTPREDASKSQTFRYERWSAAMEAGEAKLREFWKETVIQRTTRAFRFFSTVYYTRIAENGKVPSAVTLFELLQNGDVPLERVIRENWGFGVSNRTPDVTESMRVPIGKTESAVTFLDLHEKKDGPHMLVAGTTGSGKTETIISYLLALCVRFRPDELNLLLVDMKGGGFTKRIGGLPHVVGSITDVDGDENGTGAVYMLGRFLNALQSEIKRRKKLFNKLQVDSIDAYMKACQDIERHIQEKKFPPEKAGSVRKTAREDSLSHMILVVDEFTELKRFTAENENVDFMGEITTIARIGRSLGLHIILISQNIEGAITDDIRVNSKSRLCLKVATRQASKEMIGTEVAASPTMPGNGRAYLLVGTGDRWEYFQSAYSGAGVSEDEEIPVEITLASKYGLYRSFYRSEKDNEERIQRQEKAKAQAGGTKKQLDAVVETIQKVYQEECRSAADGAGDEPPLKKPHVVFYPPLPRVVVFQDGRVLDVSREGEGTVLPWEESSAPETSLWLPMGLYDAPLQQKQPIFYLKLLESNTAVFGDAMSGKTTFLKTFLLRLHEASVAKQLQERVYIVDFGGNMGAYADLPFVCACFNNSNEEDIKRIFVEVENRLEENADALGSESYADKAERPPHITLIVENLNSFLADERYAAYQERLMRLCRDGLSKGLSVIFTANHTSGVGRFLSCFGQKVALEMPPEAYYEIFGAKVALPMRHPGRGLISLKTEQGTAQYEFQCFLPAGRAEEAALLERWKRRTEAEENPYRLRAFPKELTLDAAGISTENSGICVGLDYEKHLPVLMDIQERRSVAIYGKGKFGKTNLLRRLLDGVIRIHPDARVLLLDGGGGDLTEKYLPELYKSKADKRYFHNDLDEFWEYLCAHGYWSANKRKGAGNDPFSMGLPAGMFGLSGVPHQEESGESVVNTPFTVFVLQCRKLFQNSRPAKSLMTDWLPEAIGNAEDKGYLFFFSDVRSITEPEIRETFRDNLSAAFLLDNIGEFVADRGSKSAFGDMDVKELKAKFARCSLGDGFYFDIVSDELKKLKFIKM